MRKFPCSALLCFLLVPLVGALRVQVNQMFRVNGAAAKLNRNLSILSGGSNTDKDLEFKVVGTLNRNRAGYLKAAHSVSGTLRIPADFPSIDSTLRYISLNGGLLGPTVLELQSNYSSNLETFPITIGPIAGSSSVNTLTIRPAADAGGLTISSPRGIFDPQNLTFFLPPPKLITIDLSSATNVTIDGRPGGTGTQSQLTIQNFSVAGNALRFVYGANNNMVKYCGLEGVNAPSVYTNSPAVVLFDSTEMNSANVQDTILHCLVRGIGDTTAVFNCIYSSGVGGLNGNNLISNNQIADFSNSGIVIAPLGNGDNWTIDGNSFYYDLPAPATTSQTAIEFVPGSSSNNNTITNNFIGGTTTDAGGGFWNNSGSDGVANFTGIDANAGTNGGNAVHKNSIRNINLFPSQSAIFTAIRLGALAANDGNTIGSPTVANSIQISANNTSVTGILINSGSAASVTNDNISNISVTGTSTDFSAIKTIGSGPVTIAGNTIHNIFTITTGIISFTGINVAGTPAPDTISNKIHSNNVQGIMLTSASSSSNFTGVSLIVDRLAGNTGNIIGSETVTNSIVVSGNPATAIGIHIGSPAATTINGDVIANITSNGNNGTVNGILDDGSGDITISGNKMTGNSGSVSADEITIVKHDDKSTVKISANVLSGGGNSNGVNVNLQGTESLSLDATNNTLSDFGKGFLFQANTGASLQSTISQNTITGNTVGIDNETGAPIDATCNWWGSASGPTAGQAVGNVTYSPWATLAQFISVNAGSNQTIYKGYGPQSVTLTATVVSCGSPQFDWSNGATTQSITVSPAATTAYTVTATDPAGHSAIASVTVFVVDIRCGNNKAFVCHKGNTLCINMADVPDHLAVGDRLGPCVPTSVTESIAQPEILQQSSLRVYPNPANNSLQLEWSADMPASQLVEVFDGMGRKMIEQKFIQSPGVNRQQLDLRNLPNGNYYLKMTSGTATKTVNFMVEKL